MEKTVESIFLNQGKKLSLDVSKPFLANDATKVWYIEKGIVNLSGTKVVRDEAVGKVQDFISLEKGQAFFGIQPKDYNSLCFLASPQEETTLYEMSLEALKSWAMQDEECSLQLDLFIRNWVGTLYLGLAQDGSNPEPDHIARAGWTGNIEKNQIISTKQNVVWFEVSNPNALLFNDVIELDLEESDFLLPISRHGFIRASEDIQIVAEINEQNILTDKLWKGLDVFHHLVLSVELVLLNRELQSERDRLIRKHQKEDEEMASMLEKATAILSSNNQDQLRFQDAQTKSVFYNACTVVAAYNDIKLILPPDLEKAKDPLDEISRFSSVRYREIDLEGDWYKNDGGPFLGFIKETSEPMAMLPKKSGYEAVNAETKEAIDINAQNFSDYGKYGYMLYKPLPVDNIKVIEILKFSLPKDLTDYYRLLLMALLVTLLGMLTPILTAKLFDNIIPNASKNQLIYVAFGLGMAALGAFLFDLTKSIALLRAESKMDQKLQAGVWDRLLNLPATFFSQFTAGDLAMRSLGVGKIRRLLSGVALTSILSCVFSSLNLILLFYYSKSLAVVAVILVLAQVIVNYVVGRMQVSKQKSLLTKSGKNAGIVLQMLTGIAKFRVTGTERRAFNHWMKHFLPVKDISIQLKRIQNFQVIFNRNYRLLSMMVIYVLMIGASSESSMSLGEFLSFSAAYGIFASSMVQMSAAMITVLQVFPLYERTKPILEEKPENSVTKEAPESLNGNIELNEINFRYDADGPDILKNVSMNIKSGEYVAFVGPSGSGKSTIIRLLLGFNEVNTGTINYDGQDFAHLDARMVRKKIGTVLQDGSLVTGDIYSNIIGSSSTLTVRDAWKAARSAAFADDIKSMPMGMNTVVSEAGGTISGGQRQRLMIARALVHQPNILIFDEATSALDNQTQKIVSESLDQLNVTRIVVAHRLSTIQNADTIYYLENGVIEEKGNFKDLMDLKGKFYELAKRQIE